MESDELKQFEKDIAEFPCPHCKAAPELTHIKGCFFRRVACVNPDCDVNPMTDWWGYKTAIDSWLNIVEHKTNGEISVLEVVDND